MELELLALKDILIDEIYYFFNHDTEVNNQIPTEAFNNSLKKLTLRQLITIAKIIIPFGYGTRQEFSDLINLSKNMLVNYTIINL